MSAMGAPPDTPQGLIRDFLSSWPCVIVAVQKMKSFLELPADVRAKILKELSHGKFLSELHELNHAAQAFEKSFRNLPAEKLISKQAAAFALGSNVITPRDMKIAQTLLPFLLNCFNDAHRIAIFGKEKLSKILGTEVAISSVEMDVLRALRALWLVWRQTPDARDSEKLEFVQRVSRFRWDVGDIPFEIFLSRLRRQDRSVDAINFDLLAK